MISPNNLDEVTVKFTYESTQTTTLIFKIDTKLEEVIQSYIKETKKDINSLIFLCNGDKLRKEDCKKTLYQIMNDINKNEKNLSILVIKVEPGSENNIIDKNDKDIITLIIIDNQSHFKLRGKKEESIKNIILRKNPQYNNSAFYYKNNKVDIDKKLEEIIDEEDKEDKFIVLTINYIKVNFINKKIGNKVMFFLPEKKLVNDCEEYCNENNLNINNYIFCLDGREYDFNNIANNNVNTTKYGSMVKLDVDNNDNNNDNLKFNNNGINEMDIIVKERKEISCCKRYKKLIIIISSIIALLVIVGVIVLIIVVKKQKIKIKTHINIMKKNLLIYPKIPKHQQIIIEKQMRQI